MKEKRATDVLNVQLAAIDSALTVIKSLLGEGDHPAKKLIDTALDRCGDAREALIEIQSHAAKI